MDWALPTLNELLAYAIGLFNGLVIGYLLCLYQEWKEP